MVACHPWGLHIVVGLSRRFYFWTVHAFWKSKRDEWYLKGDNAGFVRGYAAGESNTWLQLNKFYLEAFNAGRLSVIEDIDRKLNEQQQRVTTNREPIPESGRESGIPDGGDRDGLSPGPTGGIEHPRDAERTPDGG